MRAEISVLGPVEVSIAGVSVVPTATKPRQLLTMLAINAGRVVTSATLMEEIWGMDPPRSAPGTLQTYVLQIRRMIRQALGDDYHHDPHDGDDDAMEILHTRHTGYSLELAPETIDAVRYEEIALAGRTAGAEGDFETAEQKLTAALDLWRGPALIDVTAGPQLEIEAMRLNESRLGDTTLRIDADLVLGRHHQLLGELAALCARHPFMENFRAQYMVALYRSGRPGQALETFQEAATIMREQLGVAPSAQLRQIHRALLKGEHLVDDPKFMVNTWAPTAIAS
jgi:DNA-binding SARP family transcriptional activator